MSKSIEEKNKCEYDFEIDYCDKCGADRWIIQYICIAEKHLNDEQAMKGIRKFFKIITNYLKMKRLSIHNTKPMKDKLKKALKYQLSYCPNQKQIEDAINTLHQQFLKDIFNQIKTENPYPSDIFTGKTQEGETGQFGKKVWNNCIDKFKEIAKQNNIEL